MSNDKQNCVTIYIDEICCREQQRRNQRPQHAAI